MKRKLIRALTLLLALSLLPACSLAALRRGDRSEDVRSLQQMLHETGWLFEEPDGIFGKNTESAVKDFERFAGLPVDGVADDQMLDALNESWIRLLEESGVLTAGEGVLADGRYPAFCTPFHTESGSLTEYCETHDTLRIRTEQLVSSGNAGQASQLWRAEVVRLYDLWLSNTDDAQHAAITAARDRFLASIDAQQTAISGYYNTFQLLPGEDAVQAALEIQLRGHAAWLCALISGALTAREGGI